MSSTSPGVPGFETIAVLAEGPSSIVRARSLEDGAEVIVKLLDPASEAILPKRFDRRRRVLQKLSGGGQGFAPLLDSGVATDGRPYVVVPHYPLGSLQDQLDRGPTPWFPASQLMAKVAEAVGRAHQDEAPLGDIRPSKILLEAADTPVVAAFGMASRRFDDGSPVYRAPETDNDSIPTAPSDVYSLALVLGTLIAGRAKERDEPIQSFLGELVGLAPARIHEVLEHGLAESVTNRYGSGTGMHRALTRAIDEVPGHHDNEDSGSSDAELDELLHGPLRLTRPAAAPTSSADGLPPGLDDLILAGDSSTPPPAPEAEPTTEDDHLLLPPGLDDIVLVNPGTIVEDETIPFPLDVIEEDPGPGVDPALGFDALTTRDDIEAPAENGFAVDEAEGSTVGGLTIIDLTAGANGRSADDHGGTNDIEPDIDQAAHALAAKLDGHDHADSEETNDEEPSRGLDGPAEDEQEIVDLTELFTRTHEFVYDPAIHGTPDHPADDHQHSGDDPPAARPPGEPGPSPSISTTTLVRPSDPVSAPSIDHDGEAAGSATALDDTTAERSTVDTTTGEADAAPAEPAPPQMPVAPTMPAPPEMPARADVNAVDEDPTNVFDDTAADESPPWLDDDAGNGPPATTGRPFLDPDRSEAIPFPNMDRARNRVDDHRWHARVRTRTELLWFRSRRTLGTLLALLGLAIIVAIVILFAAREIQSVTNSIDTEGVPQPLTTATTSPNFVSTDAPFITDVPPSFQPTTATTARRRPATTTTSEPATTTVAPPPPTTSAPSTGPTTTERPTTEAPPTSRRTTTEREPTTTEDRPTTERTTTTRRRTTTEPTAEPSTTRRTTTEVLPTTTDDDDDNNGNGNGRGRGAAQDDPPGLAAPTVLNLTRSQASVTYSSDTCVATRFQLSGTDGSAQSGSSRGYEATVQCSSAWNLDFSGSSGLASGVGYTLTVTVKDQSGQTASTSVRFTTPA